MADNYYKSTDQILTVEHSFRQRGYDWETPRTYTYIFDFEFRTMTVLHIEGNTQRSAVHPFPSVDAHVLERMHDKLVELGGKPFPVSGPTEGKPALSAPAQPRKGLNP